ncbi:hypothetical protein ES703_18921 [subsurface metagenome]
MGGPGKSGAPGVWLIGAFSSTFFQLGACYTPQYKCHSQTVRSGSDQVHGYRSRQSHTDNGSSQVHKDTRPPSLPPGQPTSKALAPGEF